VLSVSSVVLCLFNGLPHVRQVVQWLSVEGNQEIYCIDATFEPLPIDYRPTSLITNISPAPFCSW